MKIGGVPITAPSEELLVLPRDEGDLVFRAKALPDMDEFYKLCPEPEPPGKLTKDGWVPDEGDPNYKTVVANYVKQRVGYMVVHSLAPSNIEWASVEPHNPKTWGRWDEELKAAGLTQREVNLVWELVISANALSEDKLKKARESFLRGQAAGRAKSSGLHTEPQTTPSGEPASESA